MRFELGNNTGTVGSVYLWSSIDTVVVRSMSTSWTHIQRGFKPDLRQYASRVPCPLQIDDGLLNFPTIKLNWQVEISPVLSEINNKPTIKKNCGGNMHF